MKKLVLLIALLYSTLGASSGDAPRILSIENWCSSLRQVTIAQGNRRLLLTQDTLPVGPRRVKLRPAFSLHKPVTVTLEFKSKDYLKAVDVHSLSFKSHEGYPEWEIAVKRELSRKYIAHTSFYPDMHTDVVLSIEHTGLLLCKQRRKP